MKVNSLETNKAVLVSIVVDRNILREDSFTFFAFILFLFVSHNLDIIAFNFFPRNKFRALSPRATLRVNPTG